jgi:hypothetical protein
MEYAADYGIGGLVMPEELSRVICDYARAKIFEVGKWYYSLKHGHMLEVIDNNNPYFEDGTENETYWRRKQTPVLYRVWSNNTDRWKYADYFDSSISRGGTKLSFKDECRETCYFHRKDFVLIR